MTDNAGQPARTLRILAAEVKARHDAGEPILFLDARSEKAWGGLHSTGSSANMDLHSPRSSANHEPHEPRPERTQYTYVEDHCF